MEKARRVSSLPLRSGGRGGLHRSGPVRSGPGLVCVDSKSKAPEFLLLISNMISILVQQNVERSFREEKGA